MTPTRPARTYVVDVTDDGGSTTCFELVIPPGSKDEQDAQATKQARKAAEDWVRDGEWGIDGASVNVTWRLSDDTYEWPGESRQVEIEPDHDALIRTAGGDTDCEHDWTAEGEGGCRENPGVWGGGGTSMAFAAHCRLCGLHRTVCTTGPQRNPGDHDTVKYHQPSQWCVQCQSEDCTGKCS